MSHWLVWQSSFLAGESVVRRIVWAAERRSGPGRCVAAGAGTFSGKLRWSARTANPVGADGEPGRFRGEPGWFREAAFSDAEFQSLSGGGDWRRRLSRIRSNRCWYGYDSEIEIHTRRTLTLMRAPIFSSFVRIVPA